MKVERLELRHFLSHDETVWEPDGARLVSIVGPNGAGKSSLAIDALRFAFYDDARARTDDLVRLGETDMAVIVEFAFAGATYRVARGRTTKAGGRSFLELAIRDGDAWRPLTRETIRETQAAIAELLRLDADTFAVAVALGQGQAMRFAEATAAERKRILSQVLGLDLYQRAEALARERARDVDAAIVADRARREQLDETLAGRPTLEDQLASARHLVDVGEEQRAALEGEKAAGEARLRKLEARLAAAEATRKLVETTEARIRELGERWKRESDRRKAAVAARDRAAAAIAKAPDIETAAASLAALRANLAACEARDAEARRLDDEIRAAFDRLEAQRRPFEARRAIWTSQRDAAAERVAELEAAGKALEPVICEKCGHPNVVDQADIRGQLERARAALAELLAAEPVEPVTFARDAAAIARLEIRRGRQEPADPADTARAREAVLEAERTAARAGELEAARRALAEAEAAIAAADAELAGITADGQAARAELDEAKKELVAAAPVREERAALARELEDLGGRLDRLVTDLRAAERSVAAAEARLAELDRLAAERDELAESIGARATDLAQLRRLITAFGVTGIPARIIEGVLPELSGYANELLDELRPGMTLEIRAQRAKKDGKGVVEALDLVVRDAAGERPLGLFSGGERMSVSLAIAVALSRLVARRAGTAIRTLVIDEPDGLDVDARRAFGHALRVLAHHGELERVVLVSHHEDLADVGDAVYRVSKNGHGSVVELVS